MKNSPLKNPQHNRSLRKRTNSADAHPLRHKNRCRNRARSPQQRHRTLNTHRRSRRVPFRTRTAGGDEEDGGQDDWREERAEEEEAEGCWSGWGGPWGGEGLDDWESLLVEVGGGVVSRERHTVCAESENENRDEELYHSEGEPEDLACGGIHILGGSDLLVLRQW
jgi:hypothetical protein